MNKINNNSVSSIRSVIIISSMLYYIITCASVIISGNTSCICSSIISPLYLYFSRTSIKNFAYSIGRTFRNCRNNSNVNVSDKIISSNSSGNKTNIGNSYCIKSIKRNNDYNSSTNYN